MATKECKTLSQWMEKIGRCLEKRNEPKWTIRLDGSEPAAYSVSAMLWMCAAMLIGTAVQLQGTTKDAVAVLPSVRRFVGVLSTMDRGSNLDVAVDTLSLESIVKSMAIRLAAFVGAREKKSVLVLVESMELELDDFVPLIEQELVDAKSVPSIVSFCAYWIQHQPSADGLMAMARLLRKSGSNPLFFPVYLQYADAVPAIALILVEDALSMFSARTTSVSSKKFMLENIRIALQAVDELSGPLLEYVLCTISHGSDANVRSLGLKIVRQHLEKLSDSDLRVVLAVSVHIIVKGNARSVGLSALRVLTAFLSKKRMCATKEIKACMDGRLWR